MTNATKFDIHVAAEKYRNWPTKDQPGVTEAFEDMFIAIWNAAITDAQGFAGSAAIIGGLKRGVR